MSRPHTDTSRAALDQMRKALQRDLVTDARTLRVNPIPKGPRMAGTCPSEDTISCTFARHCNRNSLCENVWESRKLRIIGQARAIRREEKGRAQG